MEFDPIPAFQSTKSWKCGYEHACNILSFSCVSPPFLFSCSSWKRSCEVVCSAGDRLLWFGGAAALCSQVKEVGPLRVNVDQDTLDFALTFISAMVQSYIIARVCAWMHCILVPSFPWVRWCPLRIFSHAGSLHLCTTFQGDERVQRQVNQHQNRLGAKAVNRDISEEVIVVDSLGPHISACSFWDMLCSQNV